MPLIFQGPKEPCSMESCTGVRPALPGQHMHLPDFGASRKLACSTFAPSSQRLLPGPPADSLALPWTRAKDVAAGWGVQGSGDRGWRGYRVGGCRVHQTRPWRGPVGCAIQVGCLYRSHTLL